MEYCAELARRQAVAVRVAPPEELTRLCHTAEHQGFLARMTDFPYAEETAVLAALPARPFCAILDGLQDPYNFGAILRSAEVFGVDAVFIAATGQVGVTSMVARSSAGAVNRVPVARVDDLEALAGRRQERGLRLVVASEKATAPLHAENLAVPSAVIIGNEGQGPRPALIEKSDARVRIPQVGRIGSLNAAVAAAIFFYEARRQRG